jgi:hypothetical protein
MLLVEEINRFAAGSERSQLAERHIAACNLHIAKQKVQVEKLNGGGNTVPLREAKRILINLLELRELYEKAHDVIADGAARSLRDLASASTRDPPYERVN